MDIKVIDKIIGEDQDVSELVSEVCTNMIDKCGDEIVKFFKEFNVNSIDDGDITAFIKSLGIYLVSYIAIELSEEEGDEYDNLNEICKSKFIELRREKDNENKR